MQSLSCEASKLRRRVLHQLPEVHCFLFPSCRSCVHPWACLRAPQGLTQGSDFSFSGPADFYDWLNATVIQVESCTGTAFGLGLLAIHCTGTALGLGLPVIRCTGTALGLGLLAIRCIGTAFGSGYCPQPTGNMLVIRFRAGY